MKRLTFAEASKRPDNFQKLSKMLSEGVSFEMADGISRHFEIPSESDLEILESGDREFYNGFRLREVGSGTEFRVSQIVKTRCFGGKDTNGTHHEEAEISSIREQMVRIKYEIGEVTIPIRAGNHVVRASDVRSTPGTPKSDFHFVDGDNPVMHVSHKKGSSPKHFQQWGGVTEKAGKLVSESPEVLDFIYTLRGIVGLEMPQGIGAFYRHVDPTSRLALASVYGTAYNCSDYSNPERVSYLVQGNVKLVEASGAWALESHHTLLNPMPVTKPYYTIIMATYKGDGRRSGGIKNCRIGIYPKIDRKATEI